MNIKRFFGKSSKEALSMVRKELGDNAVILSNRTINGGNEIMAFREEDIDALIQESDEQPATKSKLAEHESDFVSHSAIFEEDHALQSHQENIVSLAQKADMVRSAPSAVESARRKVLEPETQPFTPKEVITQPAFKVVKETSTEAPSTQQIKMMLNEMRSMRNEIAAKLNEIKQSEIRITNTATRPAPQAQEALPATKNSLQKSVQNLQMQEVISEVRNMRSAMESKLPASHGTIFGSKIR